MKIRFKKNLSIVEILALLIFLAPLLWVLGFIPFIYQISVLALILISLYKVRIWKDIRLTSEIYLLIFFITVYAISILYNLKIIPPLRLLGTVYNLTFWLEGLGIILLLNSLRINSDDVQKISGAMVFLGNFCGVGTVLGLVLWCVGIKHVDMQALFFSHLPADIQDSLFGSGMATYIISSDFTSWGATPRSSTLAPYATALGMMMLVTIPLTFNYFHQKKDVASPKLWVSLVLQGTSLLLSLSRTALLGLVVAGVLVFLKYTALRLRKVLSWSVILLVVSGVVIFGNINIVSKVLSFRQGSTTKRLYMYKTAVAGVMQQPLIGFGYKPKTEDLGVPLASHSTIVSVLYRTGFLGLGAVVLLWLSVILKWTALTKSKICNSEIKALGVAFFSGLIWQITEDLDAPQIVVFLYFLVVGMIVSIWKDQFQSKNIFEGAKHVHDEV